MRVVYMDGSGSYGTNGADDAAADALLLSRAAGQPVRVQWMRQDEHGWDPKGPAQLHEMRGAIDANGNISAWETQMWVPDGPQGSRALLGPESAAMPQTHGQGAGSDDAESRSALSRSQSADRLASFEGHAAAALESAGAGQDRQCLRGGKLCRRAGGGRRNGCGRLPAARTHRHDAPSTSSGGPPQ